MLAGNFGSRGGREAVAEALRSALQSVESSESWDPHFPEVPLNPESARRVEAALATATSDVARSEIESLARSVRRSFGFAIAEAAKHLLQAEARNALKLEDLARVGDGEPSLYHVERRARRAARAEARAELCRVAELDRAERLLARLQAERRKLADQIARASALLSHGPPDGGVQLPTGDTKPEGE